MTSNSASTREPSSSASLRAELHKRPDNRDQQWSAELAARLAARNRARAHCGKLKAGGART